MGDLRYIEVDASWWSDEPDAAPEPNPLFESLVADGWETAEVGARRRRFVRRFDSDGEYRAALAKARFMVAECLVARNPDDDRGSR